MIYKKRKRLNVKRIFFISGLILCFIIGYIANIVTSNRSLSVPEKAIKDGILTIQKVISYPIDLVITKANIAKEKNRVYDEYAKLKEEYSNYEQLKIENEELKKHIKELQKLNDIDNTLINFESINASIIGRDLAYWSDNIIIDKGQNDGILMNMPVVVADGLIGKVVKTTTYTSTVRLLTSNSKDKISVKIQNGDFYSYGILDKYDIDTNTYSITSISQNVDIPLGAAITTTGMGDIYPAGIIVGYVSGFSKDHFDLYRVYEMQSNVDFNNINYVKVLKRDNL